MGAHPGGLYGRFTPAEPYGEDLEFWTDVRDACRVATTSTTGSASGCSTLPITTPTWRSSGDERRAALAPSGRAGLVARRRGRAPARSRRPRRTTGSGPRCSAPGCWPSGSWRPAPTAVLAGAGVANLATWLGVQQAREPGIVVRADRRARAVGLRADAGRPVRVQPPSVPVGHDARRLVGDPRHGRAGPGHDDARLPRRRDPRRRWRHRLDRGAGPSVPGRDPAAATTWRRRPTRWWS